MANNLKAIRKRISTVRNTRQITRAMKLVAGAKLKRATDAALAARPFNRKLNEMLVRLLERSEDLSHPLFQSREPVRRVRIVAFSSDRGLCGSYNSNVAKFVDRLMRARRNCEFDLVTVGRKIREHAKRMNYAVTREFSDVSPAKVPETARQIALAAVSDFEQEKVDEVILVYQQFKSAISQVVVGDELLPLVVPDRSSTPADGALIDFIYEPSRQGVVNALLPQLIANRVMKAFLEASASEHGSRMTAMDNATRNASELIDKLTLEYNRARQAAITKELVEIVSGAEAL